jgi:hypothetical protein
MSTRSGGFFSSETRGAKPPHPDAGRWAVAALSLVVVMVAVWGPRAAWWLTQHNPRWDHYVRTHLRPLGLIRLGFTYGAWGFVALTVLGLLWALVGTLQWRWRVRRVRGQYWTLVITRPQGREVASRTNPEAPYVFWDRLIAILHDANGRGLPAYLATELWGDGSGQVQWGVWLPAHVDRQREAVRRLMTAERPRARLVAAPDPLLAALGASRAPQDNVADPSARWYASALLILAAPDYYPLLDDSLAQRSLVAALRPPRTVLASGVSVIVTPAPFAWARRVHQLVQRWRWVSRYHRRFDERYKQETDAISLKAQQAHARVCLRVQVVAQTKAAAQAECRSVITTLTTSRKRYASTTQHWQARAFQVRPVRGTALPAAGRHRAPFRPLPRLLGLFPFL